jgi:cytochrome c peroxidase
MMWRLIILIFFLILSTGYLMTACRKGQEDIPGKTPIAFPVPPGFPSPVYDFNNNPLTEEGFQLGKTLFYDGRLSKDGHIACASCHQQIAVFGTYDHDLSHGYSDKHTIRNAPGLFNLAWRNEFHMDGKYRSLEDECLQPMQAPNEMAEELGNILTRLRRDGHYRELFNKSFGSTEITIERMQKALAQFTVSMVTANSKYDQVKRGENTFTDYEQRGYALFRTNCAACHPEPMFTDNTYRNTGLPVNAALKDKGRMEVTGKREDSLKFRVPSLRNISITFPYMHDGRFASLAACLEHYGSGIQPGPTLDPILQNSIRLTPAEKLDLVAFLRALTDSTLVNDHRYMKSH